MNYSTLLNELKETRSRLSQKERDCENLKAQFQQLKRIIDDITDCSCTTCGAQNECAYWKALVIFEEAEN